MFGSSDGRFTRKRWATIACLLTLVAVRAARAFAGLPEAKPESVGLDAARLARIDDAAARSLAAKRFPGAVVIVGRHGKVALARVYGNRALEPRPEPMTRNTIFDMASLTKPIATATSVMILLERGMLRLEDRLRTHLPEFDSRGKGEITIEQLLRHRSGLMADNPMADYRDGPEIAWKKLADLPLDGRPGERFLYSDVNYEILGRLVEKLAGESLDSFARKAIFQPLGMSDTDFRPVNQQKGGDPMRLAPTEREAGRALRGEVHDPRARALGGVAGHAGLFSTADDLAVYASMLLADGKTAAGSTLLAPLTVRLMTDGGDTPPGSRRGLGWDLDTGFSGPRGSLFGPSSFGHTGFTGTSLWVDPETDTFVVILTNRVHPDGKGNPSAFRAEVATIVASSILDAPPRSRVSVASATAASAGATPAANRPEIDVRCGIDVLIEHRFRELRNKRVALVTNHTGRARTGESTIDVLHKAPGVRLVALMSPEHGIRGLLDAEVSDSKDAATGLPVYSLYGKTRKPTREMLENVDAIVYDIQDIGTRFYTYISTMGLVLEAARENRIPVIVLDRPNPVGGEITAGPVRDPDFASFIAFHALPVRHGMTVGELATMFNAERSIHADLTVVPCEGWTRDRLYDAVGLLWTNPSPNMRSLNQAILYPGVGLLEASNLATGRGTDTPFERVGAPYIDPRAWARALNSERLPGIRFVPIEFTPTERQFAGKKCGGVQILITDRSKVDPIDVGIALAVTLRKLYPAEWKPEGFLRMLADRDAYDALLSGLGVAAIRSTWEKELAEFNRVRARYLRYR
ncbi:MAG: DUF1343 domain-containing protein [Isosphaeraceae bacterium]|nr:DUF1343 domain-containing protein [Isosphaeraceae bacterium]